ALMLVTSLPLFVLLATLAYYFAPDALFGWPWSAGLVDSVGALILIAGPILVSKPLGDFAGLRRRNLALVLVGGAILGSLFLPAAMYLHTLVGSPVPFDS